MNNKIKGVILTGLTFLPIVAFADEVTDTLKNVTTWLSTVGGGLAVLFIVVAGIMMVSSSENADNVKKAQDIIKWAMVGLVIILLANAVTGIVTNFVK
ncbi:MAG: pilin [Candidatus Pacebacteria bacterium]|nr:pilin [Candidatus Paceibacterota bacterium]